MHCEELNILIQLEGFFPQRVQYSAPAWQLRSVDVNLASVDIMGIKREASQSSSSSSHPRRKSNTGNNEIPRVDEDLRQPKVFEINASDLAAVVLVKPEPTDRQRDTWTRILPEAKAQCVKAVVRLLVMKGARKEPVSRSHISDCLGKVDSTYKKHIDVVIVESQSILEDVFGYTLITGDEVRGLGGKKDEVGGAEGKKDEFFIFNILKSPRMLSSLSELADDEAAFTGFCYVIFQILLTSPGKAADAKTVLQKLRKVDSRFPETLLGRPKSSSASNKANPVPELKDDFLGLMGQMKK